MLHPSQFQVNEAWIAFQLNDEPIHTEKDGSFNVVALMDAASCFILSSDFIPISKVEPSKTTARRLLKEGSTHKGELPTTLFVPRGQFQNILPAEAQRQGISVVSVPEAELLIFIGEARSGFREHVQRTGASEA